MGFLLPSRAFFNCEWVEKTVGKLLTLLLVGGIAVPLSISLWRAAIGFSVVPTVPPGPPRRYSVADSDLGGPIKNPGRAYLQTPQYWNRALF